MTHPLGDVAKDNKKPPGSGFAAAAGREVITNFYLK